MRRIALWLAALWALLVLTGCGGPEQVGPPTRAEVATLCGPLTARPDDVFPHAYWTRRELFVRTLQEEIIKLKPANVPGALERIAPCLRAEVIPGSEDQVYQVSLQAPGRTIGPFLIYPFMTTLRLSALDTPEGAGTEILALHTVTREKELDVVAERLSPSAGGAGRLQLYRLTDRVTLLWEGPEYHQFDAVMLNADWALTLHQPPESGGPEAHAPSAQPPRDGEVLWHREGDRFRQVAARTFPSPLRAVTQFVGALQQGDRALAGRWATGADVVEAGSAALARLETNGWSTPSLAVDDAEAFAWSAIPADLRGPDPIITRVVWPSGPYQIITTRTESGWRVSAVEPATGP